MVQRDIRHYLPRTIQGLLLGNSAVFTCKKLVSLIITCTGNNLIVKRDFKYKILETPLMAGPLLMLDT